MVASFLPFLISLSPMAPVAAPAPVATPPDSLQIEFRRHLDFDDLVEIRDSAAALGVTLRYTELAFGEHERAGYGDLAHLAFTVAHDGREASARGAVTNHDGPGFVVGLVEPVPFGSWAGLGAR